MISNIKFAILLLLSVVLLTPASAQDNITRTIRGVISNDFGDVMPGVVVTSQDGNDDAVSDEKGAYSIKVSGNNKYIVYSFLGYRTEKVAVATGTVEQVENLKLHMDNYNLDEWVDLGFTSYKRGLYPGSVSTARGTELMKSPVANLASTFAGRLTGLITNEGSSEWARVGNSFFVRGAATNDLRNPVLVIDGFLVPSFPNQSLDYITAAEIETISVLKDATALALYGIKGAEGALVITTKRGKPGELKITGSVNTSVQELTTRPYTPNSMEYVNLRNEAAYNSDPTRGKYQIYSEYIVDKFKAGDDRAHYPDNNWYDLYLKKYAQMQRAALNLSGGSEKVTFFSNVNFMHQNTNFKTTKQDKYDPEPSYTWANFRTNVDAKLTNAFRAYLNVAGNVKREKVTEGSMANPYQGIFDLSPIVLGPLTTEGVLRDPDLNGNILPVPIGENITTASAGSNIYGRLNSVGYQQHTVTNIYSNFGLELNLASVTPGLKTFGSIGFQSNTVNSLLTTKTYQRYERVFKIEDQEVPTKGQILHLDDLKFIRKGGDETSPLRITKSAGNYYNLNYKAGIQYQRDFGKHSVSGLAYGMYQDVMNGDALTYKRLYSGVEGNYVYDNRYIMTLSMGYSGSDQFARERRFQTTPAIGGAWIVSNESFMKNVPVLDLLKLKASFGRNGNDETGMERYGYLDKITGVTENKIGNPFYQAEMTKKLNYGFEIGVLNGLRLSAEIFDFHTDNLLIDATSLIPSYQGLVGNFPMINAGKTKNKGYEIELGFNKQLSKDFAVNINGYVAYNKNTIVKVNEIFRPDDYAYPKRVEGFPVSQSFGYLVDYSNGNGFFNSKEELDAWKVNNKYSFAAPKVGDLKYRDLNGDGNIDAKDQAPIGNGGVPPYSFGLTTSFRYKAFDLTVLLQGRAKYSTIISGVGVNENVFADQAFSRMHLTAWTAERYQNGEKITFPALSKVGANANNQTSDFFEVDRSYLRLRNLELGYSLPKRFANAITASNIRFTLSGHNLMTWDKLKGYDFGPEGNYNTLPVSRVYNVGLNVQF